MDKNRLRKSLSLLNLLGFLAMIAVNYLAVALPLNNKTTEELSEQYPNLFVPAAITFSIWGVIYLLIAVFIVYQLIYAFGKNHPRKSFLEKIGLLFFISSIANICWIFAWHYEIVYLSLLLMIILLGSLIAIYQRLRIGISDALNSEKYLIHLPFSIYLGWITIATIANTTALLVYLDWGRFGLSEQFWTIVVISVGIVISLAILFQRRDIFYCMVIDWALLGIIIKRNTEGTVLFHNIITISYIGIALISLGIITRLLSRKVY